MRRQRHQEGFLIGAVLALLALLRRQYPQHLAPTQNWHANEAVKWRFTGRGDVAEGGMGRGVVNIDWFGPAGGQPDQPLADFQPHRTHRAGAQTVCRHQHMLTPDRVSHVDRTNIGMERGFDLGHNEVEGFVQIAGSVDVFDNAPQGVQHGTALHRQPAAKRE